jgi:hypothetical protein
MVRTDLPIWVILDALQEFAPTPNAGSASSVA